MECKECYTNGIIDERKRVLKLIDLHIKEWRDGYGTSILEELKQKITGEEE